MSEQPPTPATVTIDPAQRVNAPAVTLLVFGIIGAIFAVIGIALNILGTGLGAMVAEESGEAAMPAFMSGMTGVASSAIGLLIAGYIIYAATKGYMDELPTTSVKRYETELIQYVKTAEAGLIEKLSMDMALTDEIVEMMESTLKTFTERFAATVEA